MISSRTGGWLAIAVGALILASLCFRLDYLPLYEPDEARNAEVSREMNETGQFLIPQLNYEPRIKKPALFQWIVAGSQRLFDSFDTASRAPSVLAGIVMLLTLGGLGRRFLPFPASVACLMAVQGTMILFWMMARMAMVDLWLAWCVAWASLLLYGWERQRDRRRLFWLAGLAMALGFNFKGPIALALPLVAFWSYAAWRGEAGVLWRSAPWMRWFLTVCIFSVPWFIAVIWRQGHEASAYFLGSELIGRFFGDGESRSRGLFFYVGVLPLVILPWTGLLGVGLRRVGREIRGAGFRGWAISHPWESFLLSWGIGGAIFLSLGSAKMIQYSLPLIPGLALFIAHRVGQESSAPESDGSFPRVGFVVLAGLALGIFGLATVGLLKGALLLTAGGGVLLILAVLPSIFARWRNVRGVLGMALVALIAYQGMQMALTDLPSLWKTRRDFGRLAQPYLKTGVKVLIIGQVPSSVLTEVCGPVREVDPWESITAFAGSEPVMLLGRRSEISHFRAILAMPPYQAMGIQVFAIDADRNKYAFAFNRAYVDRFGPPSGEPLY
jgi:4-amino-4-deoxy-L-arabinose transferase-like glycosyltransferase